MAEKYSKFSDSYLVVFSDF
uniref:Uncharacterized protein n=1 Tax=Anguilla anguilla TaxID=7936 RepID=A0A0E9PNN1_ANGAN